MKRALLFIFMTVCVLGMSACSSKDAMPETSDSASNPVQNTDISNLNGGKIWSEQDIVSMFSLVQETDWEYIDCVLIPDHASDRVGAVLFRNDKEQTSNVAFFDADGYFQQYGTYARMSDEPDFQYLGGGAVTFRLETEDPSGRSSYGRALRKSLPSFLNFHNRDRHSICGGRNGVSSPHLPPLFLFAGILVFCLSIPDNMK